MGSEGASREFLRRLTRLLEHKVWACEIESDRSPLSLMNIWAIYSLPFPTHTRRKEGKKVPGKCQGEKIFFGGLGREKRRGSLDRRRQRFSFELTFHLMCVYVRTLNNDRCTAQENVEGGTISYCRFPPTKIIFH